MTLWLHNLAGYLQEEEMEGSKKIELTRPCLEETTRYLLDTGPSSCATPRQPTIYELSNRQKVLTKKMRMWKTYFMDCFKLSQIFFLFMLSGAKRNTSLVVIRLGNLIFFNSCPTRLDFDQFLVKILNINIMLSCAHLYHTSFHYWTANCNWIMFDMIWTT